MAAQQRRQHRDQRAGERRRGRGVAGAAVHRHDRAQRGPRAVGARAHREGDLGRAERGVGAAHRHGDVAAPEGARQAEVAALRAAAARRPPAAQRAAPGPARRDGDRQQRRNALIGGQPSRPAAGTTDRVTPAGRRLARIGAWVGGVALLDLRPRPARRPGRRLDRELFDKLGEMPPWAIVAGVVLQTAQTTLAALAWFGILRAALPEARVPYRLVLACYATAVALNSFLPANIGTWVMLLMFTTLLAGATFTMMLLRARRRRRSPSRSSTSPSTSTSSSRSAAPSRSSSASSPTTPALVVLIAIGAVVLLVAAGADLLGEAGEAARAAGRRRRDPAHAAPLRHRRRPARARQLRRPAGDRRRLPRRLRDPGHLPQRRHRHRLQLDLQQRLRHARRRRRHPGDELGGALGLGRRGDRDRLLDQPAAGHLRLERGLRRRSSSPGSSAGPAAKPWSSPPTRTPR